MESSSMNRFVVALKTMQAPGWKFWISSNARRQAADVFTKLQPVDVPLLVELAATGDSEANTYILRRLTRETAPAIVESLISLAEKESTIEELTFVADVFQHQTAPPIRAIPILVKCAQRTTDPRIDRMRRPFGVANLDRQFSALLDTKVSPDVRHNVEFAEGLLAEDLRLYSVKALKKMPLSAVRPYAEQLSRQLQVEKHETTRERLKELVADFATSTQPELGA